MIITLLHFCLLSYFVFKHFFSTLSNPFILFDIIHFFMSDFHKYATKHNTYAIASHSLQLNSY